MLEVHRKWEIDADPNLPGIQGDFRYLVSALKQLVDNALQYTSEGDAIRIRVTVDETLADGAHVVFSVLDSGNGIEEKHIARVFERFYRADTVHSTPGFGLGLPIVRRVAQVHKGYVTIQSAPDEGTRVSIYLPQVEPAT
jgi:two-component system phosphate regulon sensor histidine kinase PhoR